MIIYYRLSYTLCLPGLYKLTADAASIMGHPINSAVIICTSCLFCTYINDMAVQQSKVTVP